MTQIFCQKDHILTSNATVLLQENHRKKFSWEETKGNWARHVKWSLSSEFHDLFQKLITIYDPKEGNNNEVQMNP